MPLGGRTPDSPQPHNPGPSGPAPTDSGVCAISPSDLVGYTGNLINRVNELEQRIAELEAANIEVNQLSDLSQQIGWVGGITYMGIEGWTQTSYGTLIPPPGFSLVGSGLTMSDGNSYTAVVYDEDGVLQYGFGQTQPDGTFTAVAGAQATSGPFAIVYTDDILTPQATGTFSNSPDVNIGYDPNNLITITASNIFKVNRSGFYQLSLHCRANGWGTQPEANAGVLWIVNSNSNAYDPENSTGPTIHRRIGDSNGITGSTNYPNSAARLMYLSSSATMSIQGSGVGSSTTFLFGSAVLGIRLLTAV